MKKKKIIGKKGNYKFGDNFYLILRQTRKYSYKPYDVTCGDDCIIKCRDYCNIKCGKNCELYLTSSRSIECKNDCKINCEVGCYIKAGEGSQLESFGIFLKTISKSEGFIWWYIDRHRKLINTFENEDWKKNNPDKWNEFYAFVHNELDSATLF